VIGPRYVESTCDVERAICPMVSGSRRLMCGIGSCYRVGGSISMVILCPVAEEKDLDGQAVTEMPCAILLLLPTLCSAEF